MPLWPRNVIDIWLRSRFGCNLHQAKLAGICQHFGAANTVRSTAVQTGMPVIQRLARGSPILTVRRITRILFERNWDLDQNLTRGKRHPQYYRPRRSSPAGINRPVDAELKRLSPLFEHLY